MKAILENDLTRQSEAQMVQFSERKKNSGENSRDTVPLLYA